MKIDNVADIAAYTVAYNITNKKIGKTWTDKRPSKKLLDREKAIMQRYCELICEAAVKNKNGINIVGIGTLELMAGVNFKNKKRIFFNGKVKVNGFPLNSFYFRVHDLLFKSFGYKIRIEYDYHKYVLNLLLDINKKYAEKIYEKSFNKTGIIRSIGRFNA